jgi:hypothetical protein
LVFIKKFMLLHQHFVRIAGGRDVGPGETICRFTTASASYAGKELFRFTLRIRVSLSIAINAGGAINGIQKVME